MTIKRTLALSRNKKKIMTNLKSNNQNLKNKLAAHLAINGLQAIPFPEAVGRHGACVQEDSVPPGPPEIHPGPRIARESRSGPKYVLRRRKSCLVPAPP